MENKGENYFVGKWKFQVADMPEVIETYEEDGTFISKFSGTNHSYSGTYTYDATVEPMIADMNVTESTLEKLPLGTYKAVFTLLEKDKKIKSCTAMPGEERPTGFLDNTIISEKVEE